MEQVSKNKNSYSWASIRDLNELAQIRMGAMDIFLDDYDAGKKSNRYIPAALPSLPFKANSFELALCSHYLFLYSDHITEEHHFLSIKELCRVAKEVRIYPLLSLSGEKSKYVKSLLPKLRSHGIDTMFQKVAYEFQKGATEMVVLSKR